MEKNIKRSSDRGDYDHIRFSMREYLKYGGLCLGIVILFSYVFFNSFRTLLLYIPCVIFFLKIQKKKSIIKRRSELKKQFLTAVSVFGDYLRSGYSSENAIVKSEKELEDVWGKDSDIVFEWKKMALEFQNAKTPEAVFRDFGRRSGITEIMDFAELFQVVQKTGGKLSDVVLSYVEIISQEFLVEEQIETMISAKKFEQKIMDVMPVGIILYIRMSSPELLTPMYETFTGKLVMCVCLLIYVFAILWAEKIVRIKM